MVAFLGIPRPVGPFVKTEKGHGAGARWTASTSMGTTVTRVPRRTSLPGGPR